MLRDSVDRVLIKTKKHHTVAVFIIDGKVVTAGEDSSAYEKTLRGAMSKLLGIYNERCSYNWIYDDLVWAESNFK